MYTVALKSCIEAPWTHMAPLVLGPLPGARGTAGAFVVVEEDNEPLLRIDLYSGPSCFAFEDAVVWSGLVVIGWGERLHLVDLGTRANTVIELGGYFGHLYAAADHLLVASCDRLMRIAPDRSILWHSAPLGIDGIIVDDVIEGVVHGRGEWDPPGGWIAFTLDLATGEASR
jgi:hypothetical protein